MLVLADNVAKAQTFSNALKALLYEVDVRSVRDNAVPDSYAAVFLDGVAAPSEELWQKLTAYVKQGGGLAIIPAGDDLDRRAYSSDAAKKIMPAAIGAKLTSTNERGVSSWYPLSADLQHPFLLPYKAWFEQGDNSFMQSRCGASHYWQVENYDKKDVVIEYDDDRPAVLARTWPKSGGKVLLLTTPLDDQKPEWNNYNRNEFSFYVGLTMLSARYLTRETEEPTLNHVFGGPPPVVKQTKLFPKYVLSGPSAAEEIVFADGRWVGAHLPRDGNYSVAGVNAEKQDPQLIDQFSINIPGTKATCAALPRRISKESSATSR